MRLFIVVLPLFLISTLSWAGTFRDNFDDGNLDGWVKFGNGKWEIIDGRCKISLFAGGSCAVLMVGELDWKDYTVEMEIQANQAFDYIGFRVRVQDVHNGYPWVVSCSDNTARWYTQINNQFFLITNDKVNGDLVNDVHILKAVLEGNNLHGYYDGKLISTVQFNNFRTGKILFGICGAGPSSAFFDNIIVTGDGIPNLNLSLSVESGIKLATKWGQIRSR